MSRKRKLFIGGGIILLACCALTALGAMLGDDDTDGAADEPTTEVAQAQATETVTATAAPTGTPEPTPPPTDTPEPTSTPSPREALEQSLNEVLGDSNRDVDPKWTFHDDSGSILIMWAIDDNLTENMIRDGAKLDIYEMLELFAVTDYPYSDVTFRGTFSLVDQFGDSEEQAVVVATYQRDTVGRINFDGFLFDNVYNITDDLWMHPVMQEG